LPRTKVPPIGIHTEQLFHRVKPSRRPGVAPEKPLQPHPGAPDETVLQNGLLGVLRARGVKPADLGAHTGKKLVDVDNKYGHMSHFRRAFANSPLRSRLIK
jgi:hypothetical protein